MTLNADTLLERLHLKSQVTRWRAMAVIFGILTLVIAFENISPHSALEKAFIARLSIEGIIGDDQEFYDLIEDVGNNDHAKAVIVRLDTPGGSAVGGEEVYLRLRALSAKKPVVAVMRSLAASAGYMAALGADHIFAREGTITGSIGVLLETAEFTGLADKLGIKPIIIKSAPLKGSPNPLEKSTPEAERVLHNALNDFYNRFIDMVAERRKLPRPQVVLLADGRVYSGKGALQNKLIDALGGEEEALKWLQETHQISKELEIRDVEIKDKRGLMERLAESSVGKFFHTSSLTLDGLVAIWHPQLH